MNIIQKIDNPNISINLDTITEITKGDTIFTGYASYSGFPLINFRTIAGKLIQWDYNRDGEKLRDEQYQQIVNLK